MTDNKKVELVEEKLNSVAGGGTITKTVDKLTDKAVDIAEDFVRGGISGIAGGGKKAKDKSDSKDGNSYNNVNEEGGKQMYVQQGENTNTNSGQNQM